jgi:hypothetical protein
MNYLEQTESGREIARRNWELGWELGWALGWALGWEQGLVKGMRALLRARFGDLDDLECLTWRLIACDDGDGDVIRIAVDATLPELRFLSYSAIARAETIVIHLR